LNPGLGDLTLLMECCGDANGLADKASYLVNTNQYTSPIEENVKKDPRSTEVTVIVKLFSTWGTPLAKPPLVEA